jgi:hypothetical protein
VLQEEEGQLRKKVTKGAWGLGKEKAVTDVAVDKVKMYDDAFAKIQAATGITDINELVTSFINAEGQNFSLFNFANELNQETEKLEEQLADLKLQLEQAKGADSSAEGMRKSTMVRKLGGLTGSEWRPQPVLWMSTAELSVGAVTTTEEEFGARSTSLSYRRKWW